MDHLRRFLAIPLFVALLSSACENKKPDNTTQPPLPTTPAPTTTTTTTAAATTGSTTPTNPTPASTTLPAFDPAQLIPFQPIPEGVDKPVIDDVVKLGRMLYFDTRLSRGNDVSCASCHNLSKSGADGEVLSTGTKKQKAKRNTPTVLNAGGSFAQGWDARSTTIEEFVLPHVRDASIMGMPDDKRVTDTLESIPAYAAAFKKAFPDETTTPSAISNETFGRALGGYVKKLFARSRWDKYLAGDKSVMTDAELAGLAMFVEATCTSCHQGKYIGATQTQKLGIAKPWPPPLGTEAGRFDVTKQEADRGMWKVPSLRNVTKTGPWLHDGSSASLEETIRLMSRHQVGKELSDPQIKAIATFLAALSADAPSELTTKPQLPPSGPKTPKAD